ncbi:MAG: ARMT1-like domain-containing protein [Candidatus Omnitrophica bacterium]|nr:ARMT1-like domain-containing protein [Candidatus Omnitrophota bacterium]
MRSALDCTPCFVSQALKFARLATTDPKVHERVLREVLRRASEADLGRTPARFGQEIYRFVRGLTGQEDAYLAIKAESNRLALALLPAWRERLRTAENPRLFAVKLAIAANVIDFGIKGDLTVEQIPAALEDSVAGPLTGDVDEFFTAAERAAEILFLADNAGELVLDRLLLELLPREKITVAVKGGPAINDALMADAVAAGLDDWVTVINTGDDSAGIVLGTCDSDFRQRFARADMIVAKGQANFESLDDSGHAVRPEVCWQSHCAGLRGDRACHSLKPAFRRRSRVAYRQIFAVLRKELRNADLRLQV